MNGQWIGRYEGTNTGLIVVDLDEYSDHFGGYAYIYPNNAALPASYAAIRTPSKKKNLRLNVPIFAIEPQTGMAVSWDKIAAQFPGVAHGKTADVSLRQSKGSLRISWITDTGTNGDVTLPKTKATEVTDYRPLGTVHTWAQFKGYVSSLEPRRYIFRGQNRPLRLRTGFHRTGRADLHTFLNIDVKTLHRQLSQRTKHIFNLDIPDQNGSFLSLLQHHGYPTPLLDWTYSPFVGAFFAYRNTTNSEAVTRKKTDKVRIFVFDQLEWKNRYPQIARLAGRPHFSILEFIAIENERMVPQQSVSSVTNVDDVESYIRSLEKYEGEFLKIIDLPIKERPKVMRELDAMGITAGSLFPGIDGTCAELKERFFRS